MNGTSGQKTNKEEETEFKTHLTAIVLDSVERLALVVEMLDELITWLPDEEESPTHTFGHKTENNAPRVKQCVISI